jgi:hypothetical protein
MIIFIKYYLINSFSTNPARRSAAGDPLTARLTSSGIAGLRLQEALKPVRYMIFFLFLKFPGRNPENQATIKK